MPDQKQFDTIIQDLLLDNSKAVKTPGVHESEAEENREKVEEWQTDTLFRAIAARVNYLSMDRPDLQYSSKAASQYMSQSCTQVFAFEKLSSTITGYGDSDWAGERDDRKSTSGGLLRLGTHVVKS